MRCTHAIPITKITCNTRHSTDKDDNVFLLIQADAGVPLRYPAVDFRDMGDGSTMTLPDGGYSSISTMAWSSPAGISTPACSPA